MNSDCWSGTAIFVKGGGCHRQVSLKYPNWARWSFDTVSGGKVEVTRLAHFQFPQLLTVSAWAAAASSVRETYCQPLLSAPAWASAAVNPNGRSLLLLLLLMSVSAWASAANPRWDRPLREFMVWRADQTWKRLVSLPYLTEGTECLGLFRDAVFWMLFLDPLFLTLNTCLVVFIKEVYEKGLRDSR